MCGLTVMVTGAERVTAGLGAKAAGDGASAGDPAMPAAAAAAAAVTASRAALMFPALTLAAAASAALDGRSDAWSWGESLQQLPARGRPACTRESMSRSWFAA